MINGFEKQTEELSQEELKLVSGFVAGLKTKIGKENAITNKAIREAYESKGIKVPDARVRKIINHIRMSGLVQNLCASSCGYYVAANLEELNDYIEGLESRVNSQVMILKRLKEQREHSINPSLFNK